LYLKPRPLQRGDRISVVAPSSPISDMSALKKAERVFERYGMELVYGKNVTNLRSDCWHSADVQERIDEIHDAFMDETTSCVWAAEGGFSTVDVLPYLDFEMIRNSGKMFVGMSDITAINTALLARSGLANFSAANIRCRKEFPRDPSSLDLTIRLLMSNKPWRAEPFSLADGEARCVCPGMVKGTAIGGNLTIFCGLIGTPYIPDCTGAILFFEDVHAGGYEVCTNLNRLELSGILDRAAGIVFGEFCKVVNRGDQDICIEDVIVRKLRDRLPCIYGMNFSHGQTCAPLPIGCDAMIDAEDRRVAFRNPFGEYSK
jgi:muramoyltetrapeptide carboxypeptidase